MILGVLLGFAALAAISSLIGGGETEVDDPATDEGGLQVSGHGDDLIFDGDWVGNAGPAKITEFPKL